MQQLSEPAGMIFPCPSLLPCFSHLQHTAHVHHPHPWRRRDQARRHEHRSPSCLSSSS